MKILHVITSIERGGAENHLYELLRSQIADGFDLSVICLKGNDYWKLPLEHLGVSIFNLGLKRYTDFWLSIQLRNLIKHIRPNLIHSHLPPAELYTRIALLNSALSDIPWVISKHNDSGFYSGFGQNFLESWVARRAQHIISISDTVKQNVCIKNLRLPLELSTVIPYGIDPDIYHKISDNSIKHLREEWLVSDETYLIGAVARLVPQKSLHILLEGFSLFLKKAVIPTKLVIVGIGPLANSLKQKSIQLGIEDSIIWAGFREDIPLIMNAIDVLALTSSYEGLGLVLLEAMSAGKPTIATRISAIPEVVNDGVTGLLFDVGDSNGLAARLKTLECSDLRRSMGEAGKQRVSTQFTLARMAEQTSDIYRKLVENL